MAKFEDPFAGTPKAAIKREYGMANATPLQRARRGELFESNGLYGLKDANGLVTFPAEYSYIAKCIDHVFFLKPSGDYIKMSEGCTESGFMPEDERPYVVNGKAGIKKDGKIIIPPEYDYIKSKFGDTVFHAVKDGREMYLDNKGREVLTRVRRFEGEDVNFSPFWLCSNDFDVVTIMNYVGHEDESNPNVVMIDDHWVELERYCKDEIMAMLIDPNDDLAITADTLKLFCNHFSYEYSFYIANAKGENALQDCVEQFKSMNVFCNSWYYVVKIWQAPSEHVNAQDLRRFTESIKNNATNRGMLGTPIYAVGHSADLKPGEVRILLATHYHERCWPAQFEYEWNEHCSEWPITKLLEAVPSLRASVEDAVLPEYKEEVFNDQILDCVVMLRYYDGLLWDDAEKALNGFVQLGSPVRHSLHHYLSNVLAYTDNNKHHDAVRFFLNAALWALQHGDQVNDCRHGESPLDILLSIKAKGVDDDVEALIAEVETKMLSKGAKTHKELEAERAGNTDYLKELDYLRIDGTSEKLMPELISCSSSALNG